MIKINGVYVNEQAITTVVIDSNEENAYIYLNELTEDGVSVCLHVHGKDAVGYLDMYFSMKVTVIFDNDEIPSVKVVD